MSKISIKWIGLGVAILIIDILFIVYAFHCYTAKADIAVKNAYVGLAEKLQVQANSDETGKVSKITISVNEESLKSQNSQASDPFEKFLVAHYDAQIFWLNFWVTAIGIFLAVITFVAPMLAIKWHEGKIKEIDSDLEKFKSEKDNLLASLKSDKKDIEKSKEDAEKSSRSSHLYKQLNEVDTLIKNKRYKEALDKLNAISKDDLSDSEWAYIYAGYGTIASKLNDIPLAIKHYSAATKKDPFNPMLLNDLGYHYFKNSDFDNALKSYQKAIELNPYETLFWHNLNNLYLKQQNYPESYKCLEKIVILDPHDSLSHNNIGTYLLSLGKRDDAKRYFEKSISLDPQNAHLAYANLGYIYNQEGRIAEAIIYLNKAINIRPDIALPYANLAMSYFLVNDINNGTLFLKIFLSKDEVEEVYYGKGDIFIEEIRKMVLGILDRIPTQNNDLIDLIKKALKKFEDRANGKK